MGFCPQLGGAGPCPARCIWQGSGFAADQTNAMLATSNGGDKSSRKRKSLRLLGTAGFVEGFAIYSRETRCFFIWASRDFSPCTQCYFGISAWVRYHYPWRVLHAVETLDAQGSRWLVCRFSCRLGVRPVWAEYPPQRVLSPHGAAGEHNGSQGQTGGGFTAHDVGRVDRVNSSGTLCIVTFGTTQLDEPLAVAAAHHGGNANFA